MTTTKRELHKGNFRALLNEVRHLSKNNCHSEARLKIAIAFNQWNIAKAIILMDEVHRIEGGPSRGMTLYRATLTERLLHHVGNFYGQDVKIKILAALTDKVD
jgi:hypothetical protein